VSKSVAGFGICQRCITPTEALEVVQLRKESVGTDRLDHDSILAMNERLSFRDLRIKVDLPSPVELEALALRDPDQKPAPQEPSQVDQLHDIYVKQIKARIERIWQRPRSPIERDENPESNIVSASFQCEIQLEQDNTGTVQEVLVLPSCNGTERWRQSLLMAIRQASPLPAPPDQAVFQRSLVIRFVAFSFGAGEPEEGYEPGRTSIVQR
jgi:hypothetical protein